MLYRVVLLWSPGGEIRTELYPCNRHPKPSYTTREDCLAYLRGLFSTPRGHKIEPCVDIVNEAGRLTTWQVDY